MGGRRSLFWIPGTVAIIYFWEDIREVFAKEGFLFGGYSVLMLFAVYFQTESLRQGFRNVVSLLQIYLSILMALFFFY